MNKNYSSSKKMVAMKPKSRSVNKKSNLGREGNGTGSISGTIVNEPSIKEFTKIDGNSTSYSKNGIKANARIRLEEDTGLVVKNLKLKILGQPHDVVLLTTDRRFKHYKANEDCIILKDGLLFRKYSGETGSNKYYQILTPKPLVSEVLRSLRGDFGEIS